VVRKAMNEGLEILKDVQVAGFAEMVAVDR